MAIIVLIAAVVLTIVVALVPGMAVWMDNNYWCSIVTAAMFTDMVSVTMSIHPFIMGAGRSAFVVYMSMGMDNNDFLVMIA